VSVAYAAKSAVPLVQAEPEKARARAQEVTRRLGLIGSVLDELSARGLSSRGLVELARLRARAQELGAPLRQGHKGFVVDVGAVWLAPALMSVAALAWAWVALGYVGALELDVREFHARLKRCESAAQAGAPLPSSICDAGSAMAASSVGLGLVGLVAAGGALWMFARSRRG